MPYADVKTQKKYSRDYSRKWEADKRANDPEYMERRRAYMRAWHKKTYAPTTAFPEKWLERSIYNANRRAAREGFPGGVTFEDIEIRSHCPILGTELVYGGRGNATASLDKVVPALGYVAGNVVVISRRANRLKNDATLAELEALVSYVKAHGR